MKLISLFAKSINVATIEVMLSHEIDGVLKDGTDVVSVDLSYP